MSRVTEAFSEMRAQLEKCARQFHELRNLEGAAEHKYWKFENCTADSCAEARKALAIAFPAAEPRP